MRILLDDFNIVGKDAQVLRLAFEPNVEIRLFNPLPGSRASLIGRLFTSLHDMPRIQKRMHNKLFIADNAMGITGGRNLGDAYFGTDDKSNFVDLDVLAVGRIVRDMSASFDRYWNDELAYPMQSLVSAQDLEKLRKAPAPAQLPIHRRLAAKPLPSMPAPTLTLHASCPSVTPTAVVGPEPVPMDLRKIPLTWAPAVVMVDKPGKIGPGDDEVDAGDTLVDGLLQLLEQARQDVLIVSPYFVPGAPMMQLFARMRAKGVRIRVLTNSLASTDAPAAHAGYARYRKDLLALGVELYELRADQEGTLGGMGSTAGFGSGRAPGGSKSGASRASLHSKAVIIDQRLAVIGSMNLDLRSQLKNSEVALLIRSGALSREAARQVDATLRAGRLPARAGQGPAGMARAARRALQGCPKRTRSQRQAEAAGQADRAVRTGRDAVAAPHAALTSLRTSSEYFFQNAASCVVAKLIRISVDGLRCGVEQGAGREQVALVEHALGQRIGVHAGVDPAEQPRRLGGEACSRHAAPASRCGCAPHRAGS